MSDIEHFIGGKHVAGTSGNFGDVFNPASGEQIRRVGVRRAPTRSTRRSQPRPRAWPGLGGDRRRCAAPASCSS